MNIYIPPQRCCQNMKDRKLESYRPIVKQAAQKVSRAWPKFIEADDLEQELWLCLLQEPSLVDYLAKTEVPAQFKTLCRRANKICKRERLDYDRFHGNWWYNTSDVKGLLVRGRLNEPIPSDEKLDLESALRSMEKFAPQWFTTIYEVYFTSEATPADKKNHNQAIRYLCNLMNSSRNDEIKKYEEEYNV